MGSIRKKLETKLFGTEAEKEARRKRKSKLKAVEEDARFKEELKIAKKRGKEKARGGGLFSGFGGIATKETGARFLNVGMVDPFNPPKKKSKSKRKK